MNDTVEKKVASLEKRFATLYNRFYAQAVRRSESYNQRTTRMEKLAANYDKISVIFKRLAPVAEHLRTKERVLVTLSKTQYYTLHNLLNGHMPRKLKAAKNEENLTAR